MAEFKEIMKNLEIDPDSIPLSWEAYYIAAQNKYTESDNNRVRYRLTWYRQYNNYLDLSAEQIDVLIRAGILILQNDDLYQWSSFVRYILYETKIPTKDKFVLAKLIPQTELDEYEGLFVLLCFLAGIDESVERYRKQGINDFHLYNIFGIIRTLLNEYYALNEAWGTVTSTYIPGLARASLRVFDGIGFELAKANFPGPIYKNSRSGELLMLAEEGQLYTNKGQRLNAITEASIKAHSQKARVSITEKKSNDEYSDVSFVESLNNDSWQNQLDLPENIWQSIFNSTDNNSLVANVFMTTGFANNVVRVLDKNYWEEIYKADANVLNIYIPSINLANIENLSSACLKAWYYFASEQDVEKLEQEVTALGENNINNILNDLGFAAADISSAEGQSKNPGKVFPLLFVHESSLLMPELSAYFEPESELLDFYNSFKLFSLPEDRDKTLYSIFGEKSVNEPVVLWPETNEIQKIFKKLILDDKAIYCGGGFMTPHGLANLINRVWKQQVERNDDIVSE